MSIPDLPFGISPIVIVVLVAFFLLWRDVQRRFRKAQNQQALEPKKKKRRGPDMAFSAGRDAAQQNARLKQVFIPMQPEEEEDLRQFYLGLIGLQEMRAPNFPDDSDGFWAVSGRRQIYFGTRPSFAFDAESLPAFPLVGLDDVVARLEAAGYHVTWDESHAYIRRCVVVDPAGTSVILIAG